MTVIFERNGIANRGRVAVLENPLAAAGSVLQVEGWGGFQAFKAIFTRIHIAEQTNHQFLHTLGNRIYLYVFGDRIGQIGLTGLAFWDNCSAVPGGRIGAAHVLNYFRTQKLSVRAEPIKITIDPTTVFECYMQGFNASVINTAQRMYQFHLNLALIPNTTLSD